MGLFDFLKRNEKKEVPPSGLKIKSDWEIRNENFISINSADFFGQYHRSENGKFILAWTDSDFNNKICGARQKGYGRYILIKNDVINFSGFLQRPNDGKISNEGVFAINDWMFGNDLEGTFFVFDNRGNVLIEQKCMANLVNNGISNDGKYAVCQTANNKIGTDGNKLFFFDLTKKKLLWKQKPETGWSKDYSFDTENRMLYLLYDANRSYRYTFDGEFIDEEKFDNDRIKFGTSWEVLEVAEKKIDQLQSKGGSYDEIINLLSLALNKETTQDTQNLEARIHRLMGEIFHMKGNNEKAIEHLEIALKLNPKVGAKRLLMKLSK